MRSIRILLMVAGVIWATALSSANAEEQCQRFEVIGEENITEAVTIPSGSYYVYIENKNIELVVLYYSASQGTIDNVKMERSVLKGRYFGLSDLNNIVSNGVVSNSPIKISLAKSGKNGWEEFEAILVVCTQ